MTAGRKPLKADVVDVIDPSLDQAKITGAMAQMRSDGVDEQQEVKGEIFQLGCRVGAIQLAQVQRDFLRAAEIRLFEEIKNFKQYKHLALKDKSGNLRTAKNLQDFCFLVFGKSYSVLHEKSQDLQVLGESAYDGASRLGLNRGQMRLIRSLPDAQRNAVAEAIQAESKAEVVAIIEDLAAQLAQEQKACIDAKEELVASEKLLAAKDAKISRIERHIQKATPDQVLKELQKEATDHMHEALARVRGELRAAFSAIQAHAEDDHSVFMAGLLGQLQAEVTAVREQFNLPDVSNAADQALAAEVAQWATPAKA